MQATEFFSLFFPKAEKSFWENFTIIIIIFIIIKVVIVFLIFRAKINILIN